MSLMVPPVNDTSSTRGLCHVFLFALPLKVADGAGWHDSRGVEETFTCLVDPAAGAVFQKESTGGVTGHPETVNFSELINLLARPLHAGTQHKTKFPPHDTQSASLRHLPLSSQPCASRRRCSVAAEQETSDGSVPSLQQACVYSGKAHAVHAYSCVSALVSWQS